MIRRLGNDQAREKRVVCGDRAKQEPRERAQVRSVLSPLADNLG